MPRLFLAALAIALAASASAQVEGLGYRLAPSGGYVFFDGDAALSDGFLYGGGAGLSFGEFLELDGVYLLGSDFETDFSDISGTENDAALAAALTALPSRSVDLERYGAEVKLNLSRGAVVPFLRGGAGAIAFSPEGGDTSRSLYLLGGGGLQFTVADRYGLSVAGDVFGYRYNPGTAFFTAADFGAVGLDVDDFNNVEVLNPSVRVALSAYLGGRRPGELSALDREFQRQFSGGLGGLSLTAEPFYQRTDFDGAFNYSDQSFAGAEVGVDLGPLVGLRAFYGRGIESDDPTDFQDIQMVGGALRLRLNEGDGLVPFLSVGAGYLDVLDGYAETFDDDPEINRALAESRPFALGGAGLEIPFGRRFRAVGEVRALAMSVQDEDNVSEPDDVYLSPSYRVGLALGLGGSAGRRTEVVRASELADERARLQAEIDAERAAADVREAELQLAIDRARFEGDSLAVARLRAEQAGVRLDAAEAEVEAAEIAADRVPAANAVGPVSGDGVATTLPTPIRTNQGERIVTIPLPETGELYVRYGEPGGVALTPGAGGVAAAQAAPALSSDEIRAIIRQTLQEAAADTEPIDAAEIERRVEDRIADRLATQLRDRRDDTRARDDVDRLEDRLTAEVAQLRALVEAQQRLLQQQSGAVAQPAVPAVVAPEAGRPAVVVPADPDAVPAEPAVVDVLPRYRARGLYAISPEAGIGFGDSGAILTGLRAEYASGGRLTYVPEILVGVVGRRTFAANLDATLDFPAPAVADYGVPYGRVGLGVVNTGASDEVPDTFDEEIDDGTTALTFNLGLGANVEYGGGRFFVDFTTGNLGRFNRLTAGYRFPFGGRVF